MKPFFSDKFAPKTNIVLIEKDKIISDNIKCAKLLNDYFIGVVTSLDIDRNLCTEPVAKLSDPVSDAILKYKNHPSILKIRSKIKDC